jgi:hypothetical protein
MPRNARFDGRRRHHLAHRLRAEDLLSTVVNMADWGASHLRSASESAWRGDLELLGDHLRQASNALKAAQMTYAVIERAKAKAADDELAPA